MSQGSVGIRHNIYINDITIQVTSPEAHMQDFSKGFPMRCGGYNIISAHLKDPEIIAIIVNFLATHCPIRILVA